MCTSFSTIADNINGTKLKGMMKNQDFKSFFKIFDHIYT